MEKKMRGKGFSAAIQKIFAVLLLVSFGMLGSCSKDEVVPVPEISEQTRSINNFIWENMNLYYLWREFMPTGINPDQESDPAGFFRNLLYKPDDRWSFITNDYEGLINRLQGISKTYGHQYQLFRKTGSNEVYGIVEYVMKDSPAKALGIQRGDIFNRIDGILLDTLNYRQLLFTNETYKIGFADLIDGEVVSNDEELTITPIVMQEDPVLLDSVYNIEGKNIGYLVYNRFISSLSTDLNNVFSRFKASGVNELILDLRYNPGGSVGTATLLASLIAPSDIVSQEQVFVKYIWNDILEEYWRENEGEESDNLIIRFLNAGQNINLNRLYVLTSGNSASASELIINGLRPYMDVIMVGDTTHGKYTASITLHDEEESYNWAIQPIVLKTANVNNESDYKDGLFPDYLVDDDYFAPLGSLEEDRFGMAVSLITGIPMDLPARVYTEDLFDRSVPLKSIDSKGPGDPFILDADNFHMR